jgi:hypothetical protein
MESAAALRTDFETTHVDGRGPMPVATSLHLRLQVTDPEVLAELRRHPEGDERDRYAQAALRLGVLSLRMASGHLDAGAVREAGQKLLSDVRELLTVRATELTSHLSGALAQYFDPKSGALPQRLEGLLQQGGELERFLRQHLGSDESTLARTLASHLGDGSPIFKLLSPTEAGGLRAQVAETIGVALAEQRKLVLREFSLDAKDSALSRLLAEIGASHGQLNRDLKGQVDAVVREFSLDQPNSALSRLVTKVEAAQKTIADQFSADNDLSALNRISRLLQNTSEEIGKNLTLDDERSALSRLRKELVGTIEDMVHRNHEFQTEVRATLAGLQARREEADRSTRHGTTFEAQLGDVLSTEAQRLGDVHRATGNTVGVIKSCKTGDHVTQLGPDSSAPGARIVWEAKEDKKYDLTAALEEIDGARKNRDADVGVFVFSRKTAPNGLQPFSRYGNDIVIVWDADDPASDVYVKAAYSVGRALSIRAREESSHSEEALRSLELATRAVEKQVQHLDQIKTWSETIKGHGEKIADRVGKMKAELVKEVERLDREVGNLKNCPAESAASGR